MVEGGANDVDGVEAAKDGGESGLGYGRGKRWGLCRIFGGALRWKGVAWSSWSLEPMQMALSRSAMVGMAADAVAASTRAVARVWEAACAPAGLQASTLLHVRQMCRGGRWSLVGGCKGGEDGSWAVGVDVGGQ